MPGISATYSSSIAKSAISPPGSRPRPIGPRYAFTFWPSSVISITPWSARSAISVSTSSNGRDTSSPRVYGTTQNEQYLLQPSMIDTNAAAPSTRGGGRWSNFSISGKLMSTCAMPVARRAANEVGQAVQRLRAEHDVDVRRALHDRGALLRRDAAAHADDEVGALRLERAHAPQVVEHPLLRLLAHRARVEQDDVRVLGPLGERRAFGGMQHVRHLVRVVLVHLAAERANVELLRHGASDPGAAGESVGVGSVKGCGL